MKFGLRVAGLEYNQTYVSAIRYLIEGGEKEAAKVLFSCSLTNIKAYDFGYAIGDIGLEDHKLLCIVLNLLLLEDFVRS